MKGIVKMANSWSGIRKRLEKDLICDELKGRVRYFITKYRKAHDDEARLAILVDDKEVLRADIYQFYKGFDPMVKSLREENGVPKRQVNFENGFKIMFDEDNTRIEERAEAVLCEEGIFSVYMVTDALDFYLHRSIKESTNSSNPLVRMFAVMDRRVGKRTLRKLKNEIDNQPEWLKFFYRLRD